MTCPCKGCIDRAIGCHSKCSKYRSWRNKLDVNNAIARDTKDKIQVTRSYVRATCEKNKRRHGK